MSKSALPPKESAPIEVIAQVAHEAIRAFCAAIGQPPQPAWDEAPEWMREATYAGVHFRLENPDAPASAQHDQWMAEKRDAGWRFGEQKDEAAKTHPMMIAYEDLPEEERAKDALFAAIVATLKN